MARRERPQVVGVAELNHHALAVGAAEGGVPMASERSATMPASAVPEGVAVTGALAPGYADILSLEALGFVAQLEREFGPRRHDLLDRRTQVQRQISDGLMPNFLPETAAVRAADWTIDPVPDDLVDRRVEITGPVERKMIINALNSGANVFMADFEDATSPTWDNLIGDSSTFVMPCVARSRSPTKPPARPIA